MSTQENVELIKEGYAAFAEGDIQRLLGMYSENIWIVLPAVEGAPHRGTHKGRDQVADFFDSLAEAQEMLEFTQDHFVAQDDSVVVTGWMKARARTTGRIFETQYAHIFSVTGGKVQQLVEYVDTAAVADAYRQSAGAGA